MRVREEEECWGGRFGNARREPLEAPPGAAMAVARPGERPAVGKGLFKDQDRLSRREEGR